jgi:hypothetical protein
VRREDDLPYVEEQRGSYFAPLPTLASVGYTDEGEHWLLDLGGSRPCLSPGTRNAV